MILNYIWWRDSSSVDWGSMKCCFSLLPGPLWAEVVSPIMVSSVSQIDQYKMIKTGLDGLKKKRKTLEKLQQRKY